MISLPELQLAARNHGMPLEALRWDVTPLGLHYLLIHYDIPRVDPAAWQLTVRGRAGVSLSLDELAAMDAVTRPVTLECAGNGRARLDPRPVSQPWLLEAVGNAEWTGVPLRAVLDLAGVPDGAVEAVFTGLDRGVEGGEAQVYQRSLPLEHCDGPLLAYAVNGVPLPPQHGFPLRLVVPGWYGMASVKWLARIELVDEPFHGYQQDTRLPVPRARGRSGNAGGPHPPALAARPARGSRVHEPRAPPGRGPCLVEGRAWSGFGEIAGVDVSADGGATWEAAGSGPPPPAGRVAGVGLGVGGRAGRARAVLPRA